MEVHFLLNISYLLMKIRFPRLGYWKDQRIGLMFLGLFFLVAISIKYIVNLNYKVEKFDFDEEQLLELTKSIKYDTFKRNDYTYEPNQLDFEQNVNYNKPNFKSLFEFDPNFTSDDSIRMLNIKPWAAENLIKYRSKGGKFKSAEDVGRIYGMEADFEKLVKYISLSKSEILSNVFPNKEFIKDTFTVEDSILRSAKRQKIRDSIRKSEQALLAVDINTATIYQLMEVRGIGEYYAKIIIGYRDKLGGFLTKDQLYEIPIIPKDRLEAFMDAFVIDPSKIVKLNINSETQYRIGTHPYLNFNDAKIICLYRKNHDGIKDYADFFHVGIFSKEKFEKIKPYLAF